ncbi:response regulator [Echinicola sp. CAU 1574]|uniref:Response regulator n=1 Tax=Echinicola arenosa TaxID=2774144 RepID=A0ABR9ANV6_9BACT|nr:response regulator [Echinicola arenosa]MBD8490468.1 response regulator [Echinicola arenosa]
MVKVVLIDDDPISIFVTESLIARHIKMPCQIFKFGGAAEALGKINTINPNYLFLDLNMPEMSGWDFLERYSCDQQETEIYILSSSIDQRDINRAHSYNQVKRFLSKPLVSKYLSKIFN